MPNADADIFASKKCTTTDLTTAKKIKMNAVLKRVSNFYSSEYFKLLLLLMVIILVAYKIFPFTKIKVLAVVVILLFAISFFLRIDWAICLFIFLCPVHYVFKEIYPSVVTDLWREVFVFCIIARWLLQAFVKKTQLFSKDVLNIIIIAYILLGAMEILRSINLLVGLAGFRFMFAFVPLYFAALSSIKGENEIKKYINAILISGFIVAIIAIIQFVLLALGIIAPGTSIDFARKYARTGSIMAAGINFQRDISVLANPNELGYFTAVCLIFTFVLNYHCPEYRARHHKKLVLSIIVMLIALLLSMSRSSIISFIISVSAISFLGRIRKSLLITFLGIIILFLILPFSVKTLFNPVYTFTDAYFSDALKNQRSWGLIWQSPLLGHGFLITTSAAKKLGIQGGGGVGSVDVYFLQSARQIGLIGFSLHFLIWLLFLRNSYLGAKDVFLSEINRSVSLAILGILLAIMIASLHTSPWESVSLSGTYYVLGAITTFIYQRSKEHGSIGS